MRTPSIRAAILRKLYSHLSRTYEVSYGEEEFVAAAMRQGNHLDALLAFKSDIRLNELRSALDRFDKGVFGLCMSCKQEIEEETLFADPTARFCKVCELTVVSAMSHAHLSL